MARILHMFGQRQSGLLVNLGSGGEEETAVTSITQQAPDWMLTNRGIIWYTMRFKGSVTAVDQAADLIITHLLHALQR